jgi:hypothetical protein
MSKPPINPENLSLRQILSSLSAPQAWGVLAAFAGLLLAAATIGKLYSDSLQAGTAAELLVAKHESKSQQDRLGELLEENRSLRKTVDDLTKAIARVSACQPIREQLTETIRLFGQTKERLLVLETAHEDYEVAAEQIKTNRTQVAALEKDLKRLREELAVCQGDPSVASESGVSANVSTK